MQPQIQTISMALVISLTAALTGCRDEPEYKGRPMSAYVADLRDLDDATVVAALNAIASAKHAPAVQDVCRILLDKDRSVGPRIVAAYTLEALDPKRYAESAPVILDLCCDAASTAPDRVAILAANTPWGKLLPIARERIAAALETPPESLDLHE